ncbi:MAG: DUF3841 domain-containing protein [Chloroflexaceae bacterium]|nr:DUF3841 domain-containing protein [bacterium]NJO07896.1 DUF3841 domain-containing protein [Chloroflexaceae bacterium]
MRVWTIQAEQQWVDLQKHGVLRRSLAQVYSFFLPAYTWMDEQMQQRLRVEKPLDAAPLWFWYQWDGVLRRRPDLRFSGHLPPGTTGVRMECEIVDARLLLSDFYLWCSVLNGWYIPISLDDQAMFDAEADQYVTETGQSVDRATVSLRVPLLEQYSYPPHLRTRIIASWQRVFDLDWAVPGITDAREQKAIQATAWELRLADVITVHTFVAR